MIRLPRSDPVPCPTRLNTKTPRPGQVTQMGQGNAPHDGASHGWGHVSLPPAHGSKGRRLAWLACFAYLGLCQKKGVGGWKQLAALLKGVLPAARDSAKGVCVRVMRLCRGMGWVRLGVFGSPWGGRGSIVPVGWCSGASSPRRAPPRVSTCLQGGAPLSDPPARKAPPWARRRSQIDRHRSRRRPIQHGHTALRQMKDTGCRRVAT